MVYLYNDLLKFNGKELKHYNDNGELIGKFPASSGRLGTTPDDQNIKNTGPLPEGKYTINPKEIKGIRYFLRHLKGDWGRFRVVLHPSKDTRTYGRDGFFLHGGEYPGSAGCIDVGKYDNMLFNRIDHGLLFHDGTITLEVKYE